MFTSCVRRGAQERFRLKQQIHLLNRKPERCARTPVKQHRVTRGASAVGTGDGPLPRFRRGRRQKPDRVEVRTRSSADRVPTRETATDRSIDRAPTSIRTFDANRSGRLPPKRAPAVGLPRGAWRSPSLITAVAVALAGGYTRRSLPSGTKSSTQQAKHTC
ncbi:hypothetical protein EVAR_75363_1 [Eumeta japonica]|uniref:Uncharacterized protein n=1 Tax=Eumeta variegata TaxID=151549 RepID=A0A4C1YCP9_EUMVA|nr:hypothetical protein EVAR_75363_1 [Eumeta japonica]